MNNDNNNNTKDTNVNTNVENIVFFGVENTFKNASLNKVFLDGLESTKFNSFFSSSIPSLNVISSTISPSDNLIFLVQISLILS